VDETIRATFIPSLLVRRQQIGPIMRYRLRRLYKPQSGRMRSNELLDRIWVRPSGDGGDHRI
jgi:hypothetical protein